MTFNKDNAKALCAVIILTSTSTLFSCKQKTEKQETIQSYTIINPIKADSNYVQEYVAAIQSTQNIELRARVKGFITKIWVDEGQTVTEGQTLFTLNASEYEQEIAKAKAQLATANAELHQTEIELKNSKLLTDNNVVPKSDLDNAKAKKDAALAKIEEAKATINLATLNLTYTQVKAPFTGIINRIPNKVGALVDEGALLTTLSNPNEMFAYFNVSETDYFNYATQQNKNNAVQLKLANGYVLPQQGKIETIDGQFDQATGNISFRARFSNGSKLLKHGATGKILISNLINNAILIPQSSTFEVQENLYVFVVDATNVVKQQKIIPQLKLGEMLVVKDGISSTDKVLYEGVQLVKDGDKINPIIKSYNQVISTTK
jgi:RND family efflux transporter MFP subunit